MASIVTTTLEPEAIDDALTGALVSSRTETEPGELIALLNLNTTVWPPPIMRGSTVTAPVKGCVVSIGSSKSPAKPCVLRETTLTSARVAAGDGVTSALATDAILAPTLLLAVTEQV